MPKLKPGTIIPTAAENAAITRGIAADPDTHEPNDAEWLKMRPRARIGRPPAETTKERITIRLSPEVVQSFRAGGAGGQTRMDEALKDWLKNHSSSR